jgi:hypothetical protein
MGHSGSVIGFVLVIVLLLFLAVRLGRSFRRTTRMLKRPDYWDPQDGPDPSRFEGHEHGPGHPGSDGGHGGAGHSGFSGDHGGGGGGGGGGDSGGGHHG